jgi:hypothetical protein
MIGLPTETDEDVAGIIHLAQRIVDMFYHMPDKPKGKGVNVTVSVACFVPKPFTPFQFEPQDTRENLRRKQKILLETVKSRKITVKYHDSPTSFLEAALARGDRRMCPMVEYAWRSGSKLDGWNDYFRMERWEDAAQVCGIDLAFYANRSRAYDETMPWDHLDYGVSRQFLIRENKLAHGDATTPHCRERCSGCGANSLLGVPAWLTGIICRPSAYFSRNKEGSNTFPTSTSTAAYPARSSVRDFRLAYAWV